MKRLWVDLRVWDKEMATTAIESGADAIVVDQATDVGRLGRITAIAPDGDLIPGTDVHFVTITDKESEKYALKCAKTGWVVVSTSDWTVIPLENLVSQSDQIIAEVHTVAEAEIALTVLEKGVAGVLLVPDRPAEIRAVADLVKGTGGEILLETFTVTAIRQTGMGDRVCVDTCSLLGDGEGMLVGNSSSSFLLIHAETLENPYVAPRPFRVNAGAVHAYALMENGSTAYLSEIESGDRVLIADAAGSTKGATVGRVKIEKRPLLLVEANADSSDAVAGLVLQNAETIRLVTENGGARSVVELQVGDRVLGHVTKGGRHFGVAIDETIVEK